MSTVGDLLSDAPDEYKDIKIADLKLRTTPGDRKNFPATNQIHYCWQKYNEYVLCVKKSSGDEDACKSYRQQALSICPNDNVTMWDEQRAAGNFLGVQENPVKKDHHGHH